MYFSEHLWMAVFIFEEIPVETNIDLEFKGQGLYCKCLVWICGNYSEYFFCRISVKDTTEFGTQWSVRHFETSVNQRNTAIIQRKNTLLKSISLNAINVMWALLWQRLSETWKCKGHLNPLERRFSLWEKGEFNFLSLKQCRNG